MYTIYKYTVAAVIAAILTPILQKRLFDFTTLSYDVSVGFAPDKNTMLRRENL